MEFYTYTLPNGIRCIHKRVRSAVTHCALTVNAGSRDECPGQEGIAHFTEHALFKGTARRRAHHINCRLENLGGELNAFTTKEETVVHATSLRRDAGKAAELIADVVFHSTFPARQIEMERTVILDEINSCKDAPVENLWDDFEDLLFAGSELGHNILGTRKTLAHHNSTTISAFVERTYNTDQMVFSSIGNFSENTFRRIADAHFGPAASSPRGFARKTPLPQPVFDKSKKVNNHQAHCIIGSRAYDVYDNRRLTLILLMNLLGGPAANSLLNIALREKNGLTYNIEASYTPFSDTGIAAILFGTEKQQLLRCIELVHKELNAIKMTRMTDRKLSMAKRQFAGQLAISMEGNEGAMLGAGKSFLLYNEVESLEATYHKINAITASEIMEAANDLFADPSMLTYQ